MSTPKVSSWLSACLIAVCLVGCGQSSTPQGTTQTQTDPVQQQIEKKVQSKGPQVIPPGHTMNSGGEIVPIEDPPDSIQP